MERNFFNNAVPTLLRKDGSSVRAIDALKDAEFVLVYFSAHWCPPCRRFTPLLKKFYEEHHETKKFEVVFMSLDNSEEEMLEYFKEAHGNYYCLPYADAKPVATEWSKIYEFQTIPTLLVFENSNPRKVVAKCGDYVLPKDPKAESFPWRDADAMQPTFFGPLFKTTLVLSALWLGYSYFRRK